MRKNSVFIVCIMVFVCILVIVVRFESKSEKWNNVDSGESFASVEECSIEYNQEIYEHDKNNSTEKLDRYDMKEKCLKRVGTFENVYKIDSFVYEEITIESNGVGYLRADENAVVYINGEKNTVSSEKLAVEIKKGDNVVVESDAPVYFYTNFHTEYNLAPEESADPNIDSVVVG